MPKIIFQVWILSETTKLKTYTCSGVFGVAELESEVRKFGYFYNLIFF